MVSCARERGGGDLSLRFSRFWRFCFASAGALLTAHCLLLLPAGRTYYPTSQRAQMLVQQLTNDTTAPKVVVEVSSRVNVLHRLHLNMTAVVRGQQRS